MRTFGAAPPPPTFFDRLKSGLAKTGLGEILTKRKLDAETLAELEEALIRGVAPFGIAGERNVGYTGVWTQGRKLASIGVHARDWVTWHGFALNVTTDLGYFDLMVPCGIADVQMTSVARELDEPASPTLGAQVRDRVIEAFADVFSLTPTPMEREALQPRTSDPSPGATDPLASLSQ